ncbi:aminotransferase [Congregibacter litoralis]|uniref:Aminotransferase n=1 Tax=Congregibacter litoralis KT71 TaxID=314285 RepID=A4A7U3_9GAMM|nr:aminotransferase [Congregibacter litoralis]EAQ97738.1 Aspartate/tyrosine/aromatic aminotransferase [Congregibacter litoralis KT71]
MKLALNPDVLNAIDPPIAEAHSWIEGREFPADKPLLDLAQGVPSYPPAKEITEHVAERAALFETAQYTGIKGIPELRETLANHVSQRYRGYVAAENILITAGCNQAFCLAIQALARAGDAVMLPVPYYFNHQMWLEMLGIEPIHLPFRHDRAGVPDPKEAAALLTDETKAIVLVSPGNPTGAVYPPAVISEFRDLAAERGIALILDETYRDFLTDEQGPPHDLIQKNHWDETLVQLYSFSKTFSLTGYRIGAVSASARVIDAVAKVMDTVQICTPRISQDAALFGLKHSWPWVAEKRALLAGRENAMKRVFRENDLGYELISAGGYFAYIRHPFELQSAREVARRLADEQNILCLPGSFFGPGQERFLRFAFANIEASDMDELARRLQASAAQAP